MNITYKRIVGALLLLPLLFSACDDLEDRDASGGEIEGGGTETTTVEMYVLNEGLFNLNNSTLSRYSFKSGELTSDYFRQVNRRGLGDTANDMAAYGSKLYIVVNASSQIEVLDLHTGASLKQIPMLAPNGSSRQPRYIAFYDEKAYVCSFDGTVARIDTASLDIDSYTRAGRNPDGICVQNRKLYVSNSGGLDWEGIGVDNTVSVIDLATFTEIRKITVGANPGRIEAAQNGNIYVATRGVNIEEGDYHLVEIDSRTDQVKRTYNEKVLNFALNGNLAYLYNFDYRTQQSAIKVLNLQTGRIERDNFITDGTKIATPYAIQVNPYNGNIYITDAYNYQVKGDVLCFNPQGQLQLRVSNVGINPNTIVFRDRASQQGSGDNAEEENNAFANRVLEYVPAPGQYANTGLTAYKEGFTAQQVLAYAGELLRNKSLLSLGGWGGYVVVGFKQPIRNVPGEYDFRVHANAYYDLNGTATGALGGSSEPGIVLVSHDANANGLADDEWYELAGSEYGSANETRPYEITYFRPTPADGNVRWTDNQGAEGYVMRNTFHQQTSYYPAWMPDRITFRGTRLADNAKNEGKDGTQNWVGYCYPWGYADNHPNAAEGSKFKIDWAVDATGKAVHLTAIDFVKIYTAVNQDCGWVGEISTEVQTVEDLHPQRSATRRTLPTRP